MKTYLSTAPSTCCLLHKRTPSSQWEITQWPLTRHNVFQQFSTAPKMCVCEWEIETERDRERNRPEQHNFNVTDCWILREQWAGRDLEGIDRSLKILPRHLPEKNQEQFQFGLRLKPNYRFTPRINSDVHDCFSCLNPEHRVSTVYKIVTIRYVRSSCKVRYIYISLRLICVWRTWYSEIQNKIS